MITRTQRVLIQRTLRVGGAFALICAVGVYGFLAYEYAHPYGYPTAPGFDLVRAFVEPLILPWRSLYFLQDLLGQRQMIA